MPGTFEPKNAGEHSTTCARCQVSEAVLVVRTEYLCRDCFMKYVGTKVTKRLESNKIRGAFKDPSKTLLLPISLGVSSVTMLHVLDQQLTAQYNRNGRSSYDLRVLFVDQSDISGQSMNHGTHEPALHYLDIFDGLKQKYSSHMFVHVPLNKVFDYSVDWPANGGLDLNDFLVADKESWLNRSARLQDLLSSLPSATSKADMISVLRTRLIVGFARVNHLDGILWGDSTTRLAERTLSETAKGRGMSLPWLTADGLSPYGIKFCYPMRDLLKKELTAFATMTSPPLTPLILVGGPSTHISASSKDTTIDDLMSQYFESVEENYPSIVANVVRTSGRLVAPAIEPTAQPCGVCKLPLVKRSEEWGGNQESHARSSRPDESIPQPDQAFCYGCARSVLKPNEPLPGV